MEWLKKVLLNCIATAAATAIAVIGNAIFFQDVNWMQVGSAALLSFIVCLLGHIAKIGAIRVWNALKK